MELGEFLFMIVQQMTDMALKELEARGVPVSLRPLVMDCVCKRIIMEAYDHLVAVRAKEAQEAVAKQTGGKEKSPGETVQTASTEEFVERMKHELGPNSLTQVSEV